MLLNTSSEPSLTVLVLSYIHLIILKQLLIKDELFQNFTLLFLLLWPFSLLLHEQMDEKGHLKKPCSLLTGTQIHPVNKIQETAFRG